MEIGTSETPSSYWVKRLGLALQLAPAFSLVAGKHCAFQGAGGRTYAQRNTARWIWEGRSPAAVSRGGRTNAAHRDPMKGREQLV